MPHKQADNNGEMLIRPVARIYTDFNKKFGIPRQSGMAKSLTGRIVFEPEYRQIEVVRRLDGFSHIWLIWQFSETITDKWHATVRPPRLGGNLRVGVFASRSPFRPNSMGLSCVKIESVDMESEQAPVILVSGVDILNGTPVYDIKPYIPVADCHTEASEGYTASTRLHSLRVDIPEELLLLIPEDKQGALQEVLAGDPRPGYDDDPGKEYGLSFAGMDIGFKVNNDDLTVIRVEHQ